MTFVQIHALQTIPPSLVNRDDTNSVKTATFGGVQRQRISSQSWKRAMRDDFPKFFDEEKLGIRTREIPLLVAKDLMRKGIEEQQAIEAAEIAVNFVISVEDTKKKDAVAKRAKALFFLTRQELSLFSEAAQRVIDGEDHKEVKKSLNADFKKLDSSFSAVDVALFGRMLASDKSLSLEASSQVAHAISTHEMSREFDFYTAVDEIEEGVPAGMLGITEFSSSTVYRYACVDVDMLIERLGSREELVRSTIQAFLQTFITSMPQAKMNSFANKTLPGFVLVQAGNLMPFSLVNAFESPVRDRGNIMASSIDQLVSHFQNLNSVYGDVTGGTSLYLSSEGLSDDTLSSLSDLKVQKCDSLSQLIEKV